VQLDIILYGVSLVLEFVALAVLRVREPDLPRTFRVPGGLPGVIAMGVPPTLILGAAFWMSFSDPDSAPIAMKLAVSLMAAGPVLFFLLKGPAARRAQAAAQTTAVVSQA
jgi:hypothetical protein